MRSTIIFLGLIACLFVGNSAFVGCENRAAQLAVDPAIEKARIDSIRLAIHADEKSKKIADIIRQKVESEGFNGNALVAQSDVVLYQGSNGWADIEDSVRLNSQTKFQLASLSKTFTSVAILKLIQEGKLNFSTTIEEIYPNFPYKGVTIHSLLSHRSGLPYYEYLMDKETHAQKWHPTNQEMMQWFASQNPPPRPYNLPDHFFSYNNTNFAILAAMVEKVSKKSFDEFLQSEILRPLGMNDTYAITSTSDSLNINRSFGYQGNRRITDDYYNNIVGDKGIYSTTGDLLKWYQGLRDGKVVGKELLQEAFTPRSFEHPGLRNYGYGFRLWVDKDQRTDYIYHTGWWKGYNTIMFFDLRSDFVVILLSNRLNRTVYNVRSIVDALHGDNEQEVTVEENILDV